MQSLGQDQGCPRFQPVNTRADGEFGCAQSFVDGRQVERNLDDRFHVSLQRWEGCWTGRAAMGSGGSREVSPAMIGFLARRLLWFALTLLAVITVSFFLMRSVRGGPFSNERSLHPVVERNLEEEFFRYDS